jgi:predicted anti-sigma-YlaC factor YlaD
MKCSQIRRKLSAFLDGEVTEAEKQFISAHLKSCQLCRKKLEELSKVLDVLDVVDEVQVSPFFVTRLKHRITEQESKSLVRLPFVEWIRRATVPVFSTALVCLSLLLGYNLGKMIHQEGVESISIADAEVIDVLGVAVLDEFPEGSLGDAYSNLLTGGE